MYSTCLGLNTEVWGGILEATTYLWQSFALLYIIEVVVLYI